MWCSEATTSARTPFRRREKKQSSDCAGSRRLSTIAKRIARVGRDTRDEVISWRSKARVFCSIRAVVRIKRRGKRDRYGCVSSDAFRSLFVCLRVTAKTRKKSESRASRVARATRERRIERAKSFETYRTHRFHRGLGRFARILPLSRADCACNRHDLFGGCRYPPTDAK